MFSPVPFFVNVRIVESEIRAEVYYLYALFERELSELENQSVRKGRENYVTSLMAAFASSVLRSGMSSIL